MSWSLSPYVSRSRASAAAEVTVDSISVAPPRTHELRVVAERLAAALPPVVEEVVLTGSVSRGVADHLSDIEMLVVTTTRLDLAECFAHARNAGLVSLDTWGVQGTEVSRVFAEASVAALLEGEESTSAEALANGIALRTVGLLEGWQGRLHVYPEALAAARIEQAAVAWGGCHPTGFLTLARPDERLALIE